MAWDSGMGGGDKPDRPDKPERPDKDRPSDWFSSKKPSDIHTIDQLIDDELAAEAEQARRDSETSTESEPEPTAPEQTDADGDEIPDAATDDQSDTRKIVESDEYEPGPDTNNRPVVEGDRQDHRSPDAWDDTDPWKNSIDQNDSPDAGDQPAARYERADSDHKVTPPPIVGDYDPETPPTVPDRYLVRDQYEQVPAFDGKPTRNQVAQGSIGDCGIVATMAAVAGHMPATIGNAFKKVGDGEYEITLHQVTESSRKDPVARPTGDTITYRVNDELPVRTDRVDRPPAGVEADICGWPALMEKVIAAEDQTWDDTKKASWDKEWMTDLKPGVDSGRVAEGLAPSPDAAPTGYNRLDMGSTSYDQADLLARITGQEAEVREIPGEQQGERALLDEFRALLREGNPILVGTRAPLVANEAEPFSYKVFAFGHAYEVTGVDGDKIQLRNPWGDHRNPPPMDVKTFWEYYRDHHSDGSRSGQYATLNRGNHQ